MINVVKISNFFGTIKDVWLKRLKHWAVAGVRHCKLVVLMQMCVKRRIWNKGVLNLRKNFRNRIKKRTFAFQNEKRYN